ncbi:hypothetical protein QFC21_000876 [Naganishia friedmannii]|uniref:Uncharacterized protein n=1 Tax=Naganishia friedmannii TaxID=89922 RepID=A0ACC2W6P5_9TREE|nr:hypothetical protein QFC21_000876 [Naganishia friedmannii]
MSAHLDKLHASEHALQINKGNTSEQGSTPISTPRKRQKTVDLGLEGGTGLMTPPDSRHKRSARKSNERPQEIHVDDEGRAGTDRSAKRRRVNPNVPAPNPPSAPFPTPRKIILRVRNPAEFATPPPTPSTKALDSRNTQEFPLTPESSSKQRKTEFDDLTPWKKVDALPPHLANLLALHKSFDLALSLHVATHPPVLPPLEASLLQAHEYGLKSLDVDLDALTNYVALKPMVEKSCGKRFGLSELKRLMWLWQWTGEDEGEGAATSKPMGGLDSSPFLDECVEFAPRRLTTSRSRAGNLMSCYNVTPTRTIDTATSRRVHTYGFGIRITLTPREAASACNTIHSMNDSFGNAGKAVGAVARWSAGSEARCKEVERRLWAWVDKNSKIESEIRGSTLAYPSSPTASADVESKVPHVPCAALPQLQQAVGNLMPAFNLAASAAADPGSPSRRLPLANNKSSPLSSLKNAAPGLLPPPAFRSVNQRLHAVAGNVQSGLPTLKDDLQLPSRGGPLKGDINEDVFGPVLMIPKETKVTAAGSAEARQQALYDRIKARANKDVNISSSRPVIRGGRLGMDNMSASQTQDELKRRSTLSRLEGVAEAVWMFFSLSPSNTASMSSPGSSPRAKRRAFPVSEVVDVVVKSSKTPISGPEAYDSLILLTKLCPSFLVLRTIAKQEWLEMPATAHTISSPGSRLNLAGPSSPGKVVMRGGGGSLREVRERIRRELGDM